MQFPGCLGAISRMAEVQFPGCLVGYLSGGEPLRAVLSKAEEGYDWLAVDAGCQPTLTTTTRYHFSTQACALDFSINTLEITTC